MALTTLGGTTSTTRDTGVATSSSSQTSSKSGTVSADITNLLETGASYDDLMSVNLAIIADAITEEEEPAGVIDALELGVVSLETVAEPTSQKTRVTVNNSFSLSEVTGFLSDINTDGTRPKVILSIDAADFAVFDTHNLLQARRLVRYMRTSNLDALTDSAMSVDPDGIMTALAENVAVIDEELVDQFAAIQYARKTMNTAADAIDLKFSEVAIMDLAASNSSDLLTDSEASGFIPPASFEGFLKSMVGITGYDPGETSNTKMIAIACNDIVRSIYTLGPGADAGPSRGGQSTTEGYVSFGVTEASSGLPESSTYHNSRKEDLFSPGLHNLSALRFRKSLYSPVWAGDISLIDQLSTDSLSDRAVAIATTLSNILITSAGIGRLSGTEMGSRFSVTDGYGGLEKAFGALPMTVTDNILNMSFEEGSILDSVVIGEELGDTELRILPFESGHYPNQTSPPVVSGRDYFTELPIRYPTAGRTNNFSEFASSFSSIVSDSGDYLEELYAVSEDTNLSPDKILAAVLQEFATYLQKLSISSSSFDYNEMTALSCKVYSEARAHDGVARYDAYSDSEMPSAISSGYAGIDSFYGEATLSSMLSGQYTTSTSGASVRGLTMIQMLARQSYLMSYEYDQLLSDTEKSVIPTSSNLDVFADDVYASDSLSTSVKNYRIALEKHYNSGGSSSVTADGILDETISISPSILSQAESLILFRDMTNNRRGNLSKTSYIEEDGWNIDNSTDPLSLYNGDGFGVITDSPDDSLVYSSVRFTRSLQKAAMELSKRNGADETSYLDSNGLTNFGNVSDNQIMFLVTDLYSTLAKMLFSIKAAWCSSEYQIDTTETTEAQNVALEVKFGGVSGTSDVTLKSGVAMLDWDHDMHQKMSSTLAALVSSIQTGSKLTDLFTSTGEESSIAGVSKTSVISLEGTTPDMLINMLERSKLTRRHVKYCASLLKSVADNLTNSSSNALDLVDFLSNPSTNSLESSGMSDSSVDFLAKIYTAAAKQPGGNEYQTFRHLTSQQLSLKLVDKERMTSEDGRSSYTMKSATMCKAERVAVDSLVDKIAEEDEEYGNGYIISSIGMPSGAIELLRRPTGFSGEALSSNTSTQIKVTKSTVSEVFKTLTYPSQSVTFDFELFLLPDSFDSITTIVDTGEDTTTSALWADVVDSAILYRVRAGEIVESGNWTSLGISVDVAEAHVRSHVVSLLFFEIFGISLSEGDFFINSMSSISKPAIDKEAYDTLESVLSDTSVASSSGLNANSLHKLLLPGKHNNDFYFAISDGTLDNTIHGKDVTVDVEGTQVVVTTPPSATREELRRIVSLGQTNLYAGKIKNSRIMAPSRFDRVFNFMLPKVYSDGDQVNNIASSGTSNLPGATVDLQSDIQSLQDAVVNYDVDDTGTSTINVGNNSIEVKELAYHLDTIYYSVEMV